MANIKNIKALFGCTVLIMIFSCSQEKKIQSRIQDAIKLDHLENPCVSDSLFTTTQGETLVLIDTVRTTTTDTLTQTDTLKTTITITKHRTDTVMAVVVDKRGLKDAADSIARYKLIAAKLEGQLKQQGETLAKAEKQARMFLFWLLGVCVAVVIGIVLWIVIKLKP